MNTFTAGFFVIRQLVKSVLCNLLIFKYPKKEQVILTILRMLCEKATSFRTTLLKFVKMAIPWQYFT